MKRNRFLEEQVGHCEDNYGGRNDNNGLHDYEGLGIGIKNTADVSGW